MKVAKSKIGRARKAYEEAIDTAREVCKKAIDTAWKAYEEAIDTAREAYLEAAAVEKSEKEEKHAEVHTRGKDT